MTAAARALLWASVSGTAMGLLLMGLRRVMKNRLPSAFYYYACILVLARLVLPLPGLIPAPAAPAGTAVAYVTASDGAEAGAVRSYGAETFCPGTSGTAATAGTEAAAETESVSENAVPAADPAPAAETGLTKTAHTAGDLLLAVLKTPGFWAGVWALGTAVSLLWRSAGYRRFYRALKRTLLAPGEEELSLARSLTRGRCPALARSPALSTPMLIGLKKPTLVLPDRDYTPRELKSVLAHELTHYRRRDVFGKWLSELVFSLHWFNPFMGLFRREMAQLCELSCDERLLQDMDAEEKRQYGNTLLNFAEKSPLPGYMAATAFSTGKQCLKERLEQIMTYNKKRTKRWLLPAIIAVLALAACGMAIGPAASGSSEEAEPAAGASTGAPVDTENAVHVSTVDELLAAIAPDTTVCLEPGVYDLSAAADYGGEARSPWYAWEPNINENEGGAALVIQDVENLALVGGEDGQTTVSAVPRYVDVITLRNCTGVTVENLTVGHTEEPGYCTGGVVCLESSDNIYIDGCDLYGCGILGIEAVNCRNVTAERTNIYDCSYGAVDISSCYNVLLLNCSVYDCEGSRLFDVGGTKGFAVVGCDIYENSTQVLLSAAGQDIYLLGTRVRDNAFNSNFGENGLFDLTAEGVVIEGCAFENNDGAWYAADSARAVSLDGTVLTEEVLEGMALADVEYSGPAPAEEVKLNKTVNADGVTEVHAATVDEFLAAIGPDTVIYLDNREYNLSKATNYGGYGGAYYYWKEKADGFELVISGVENLRVEGSRASGVTVSTDPRYSEVLSFYDCENVTLTDVTVGHTEEPGSCGAGVLYFQNTNDVTVRFCGLYGCGVLGVRTYGCRNVTVENTEIYDCSDGPAAIRESENVAFNDCDIHDCGNSNQISVSGSENVTRDGERLA